MIPVVWMSTERMSFACCNMLNLALDRYPCAHYPLIDIPASLAGGVVVFHGGGSCGTVNPLRLNDLVRNWDYVIFISVGDEAQEFPTHLLYHSNKKLWVQAPISTTKADRYLVQGYPAHTLRAPVPRDLDFFFAGQSTHDRRRSCALAIQRLLTNNDFDGRALFTNSFGSGFPQQEYLVGLSRARIAPCPAGPATVDTFRVYEALECGAIPILDSVSLRESTRNVWPLLLGDHPLPVIEDWSTLPSIMPEWLIDWESKSRWIGQWWRAYRNDFDLWLARDLISLGVSHANERKEEASSASTPAS